MALLDTMKKIEERRTKVLNRRQRQMANGEQPDGMPIDRMQLRRAFSRMNDIFKENRKKVKEERERQMRVNQAMQQAMAQENQQGQTPAQPQMAQQQMPPQAPQGLLGGSVSMMQGNPQGGLLNQAQAPTGPYGG